MSRKIDHGLRTGIRHTDDNWYSSGDLLQNHLGYPAALVVGQGPKFLVNRMERDAPDTG